MVEESFEYLDAPVERICGADVPMPYAANLERLAVPQVTIFTVHRAVHRPPVWRVFPGSSFR